MQSGEKKNEKRGARGDEIVNFTRKEEEQLQIKLNTRQLAEEGREIEIDKISVAVLLGDDDLNDTNDEQEEMVESSKPSKTSETDESSKNSKLSKILRALLFQIKKRWFLLSIFGMIVLAVLFPKLGKKGGPLAPQITVKIAIAFVFFFSGYFMKVDEMIKAIKHWQLHVYIQFFCFIGFPVWAFLFTLVLGLFNFNKSLIDGIIILACIPTTTTTNVIATVQANGNEAAALFNSAFGNSIGVFVSPAVVYVFFAGSDVFSHISFGALLLNLFITIIAPLIVGHVFHRIYIRILKTENRMLAKIGNPLSSILLLFIVFCTFCDSFSQKLNVSSVSILVMGLIDVVLYLSMVGLIFLTTIPKFWRFSRADRIAAMFTSPQKTLALGIALISGIFADDPNIGVVSIPLMIYHPIQIILGGFMVTKLKEWKEKEESSYGAVPLEPI